MPSLDERREVGARLRYVAEHGAPEWETSADCIAICLKEPDSPLWSGTEKLFALLADLIEPEPERTCKMYRDEHGTWHCESCENGGDNITGSDGVLDMWYDSWHPNYCPWCGAKIVD